MPGVFGNSRIDLSRIYLLYDSRCGSCTRFMKIAKLLDLHGKLTPLSIHDEAAEGLVSGLLSTGRLKRSFHVLEVTNSGSDVYSAGDGLVRLTRYTPGGRITYSVVSHVKILRQFVRWSYYQATKVRLASKSCSLDDAV